MADPTVIILTRDDFAALLRRMDELEARVAVDEASDDPSFGPCTRCGYGPWRARRKSRACPQCRSAYWDREPRMITARRPDDPPRKEWRTAKRKPTVTAVTAMPPLAPTTRPVVILPPELRPPGEGIISPPPVPPTPTLSEQLAERVVAPDPPTPPVPVEHVAVLPDAIVEGIVAGGVANYDEIAAAKENVDASTQVVDPRPTDPTPVGSEGTRRPVDPALQAKKDAFFADAITAGLVAPVPAPVLAADQPAPVPDAPPFVTPTDAAVAEQTRKDDPFWK